MTAHDRAYRAIWRALERGLDISKLEQAVERCYWCANTKAATNRIAAMLRILSPGRFS